MFLYIFKKNYHEADGSILGDPGADCGGKGKSKPAKENGNEEKHSRARRAPGDKFLPDQFQTAGVNLNSDWCQKFFVFFCPIHLYHSAAILESLGNKGFVFALSLPVQPRIE